jgi:hypothetical protein
MEFKSSDLQLTIQKIDIKAFLDWCHKSNLDYFAYYKDFFHGQTINETPEEILSRMPRSFALKKLVVAYLYDVRPEFISSASRFDHPDHGGIGYYEVGGNGKYDTFLFSKGFALKLLMHE